MNLPTPAPGRIISHARSGRGGLGLSVLLVLALALPALGIQIENGYYTVAWQLPDEGKWPQTLLTYAGPFTSPALGALDPAIAAECGTFQVDVYKIDSERDQDRLADRLSKGTLGLNEDGLPEDNKIYHSSKTVEGTGCESTTTTTIGTTTTSEGSSTTTTTPTTTTTSTTSSVSTTTSSVATTSSILTTSSTAPTTTVSTLPFTGVGDWIPLATIAGFGLLLLGGLAVLMLRRSE